jgi:hypothetical protein
MYQKLAAADGDVELMQRFEQLTSLYGCPVRGTNHWFWPDAPTSAWGFRGNTTKFTEDDWANTHGSYTLYIPPFVQDAGLAFDTAGGGGPSYGSGTGERADPEMEVGYTVAELQSDLNAQLSKLGCSQISVDNSLGPQTCGALAKVAQDGDWWRDEATTALEMCSESHSFNYQCKAGAVPVTKPPERTPRRRGGGIDSNTYLIGGAAIAAALLIGGAYYYRSM